VRRNRVVWPWSEDGRAVADPVSSEQLFLTFFLLAEIEFSFSFPAGEDFLVAQRSSIQIPLLARSPTVRIVQHLYRPVLKSPYFGDAENFIPRSAFQSLETG